MGLVVFRHGQDGDLGDGTLLALDTAGPFVHGRKVGVQVTGVAAAAGDFFTGCGNFAKGVGVVGDIGDDDQYVHAQFVGQVFGSGDGHTRGGDTFYRRVVGQVDEHNGTGQRAGAVKVFHEVVGFFEGDTYGREYNGEAFAGTQYLGLTGDLRSQLGMGQTGAGEYRQLLAADQGVQSVDGADAGLDEFGRIVAGSRVHGFAVDIPVFVGNDIRAAVDGTAHPVKHTAQHGRGYAQAHAVAQETGLGIVNLQALGAFKQLNQRLVAVDNQHLAAADLSVGLLDLHQFVVFDTLDLVNQHQGADDLANRLVIFTHRVRLPLSVLQRQHPVSWRFRQIFPRALFR